MRMELMIIIIPTHHIFWRCPTNPGSPDLHCGGRNGFGERPILKDSKGDPSKKNLLIKVDLVVKSEEDKVLTTKTFVEEFSYDVQSDKFKMSQYEGNITNNLNGKISNDIILLLGTLEW